MTKFIGIEYARGATENITNEGPAFGPRAIKQMFPTDEWTDIVADNVAPNIAAQDRFGDAFEVHKKVYAATPHGKHIMIGGDHSVNFGHFAAIRDQMPDQDVCLIYIDAHLDIHTPESSKSQASGAPHGTNVRALLGDGDERWLKLIKNKPALRPENLFYIASRSFEPAEIEHVRNHNIYIQMASDLKSESDWQCVVNEIREKIGNRPFVVSFDFDAIDPSVFSDVLVPEPNGISLDAARYFTSNFRDATSFEFVEYAPTGDKTSADVARELISIVANG